MRICTAAVRIPSSRKSSACSGSADTTFEAVRDTYRRDHAVHLMQTGMRITETARRLRFQSVRGLVRALARWETKLGAKRIEPDPSVSRGEGN